MQAITVRDRAAGAAGLTLSDILIPTRPKPMSSCASTRPGSPQGSWAWSATWTDRGGRDRTPSVPGHELSGVVLSPS